MSITGAMQNALSGLTATNKRAEVISANISNALTPGYGKREVVVGVRELGGVSIQSVTRSVDQATISSRQVAQAHLSNSSTTGTALSKIEAAIGLPEDRGSLSGRLATFEASLIEAASRPDQEPRLATVLSAASAVTDKLQTLSDDVQTLRETAEQSINAMVKQLNAGLARVEDINRQIFESFNTGQDVNALYDQRQVAIDSIAQIVPINTIQRPSGVVALYTTNGQTLIDGPAGEFDFSPVGVIVPEMSLESGALSGLSFNGNPIATSGDNAGIAGGALAAEFALRDNLAPELQRKLDEVARDLIVRFEDPAVDTTLVAGDPGLFTDADAAFDDTLEIGLAGRISVNALVDPDQGGEVWRLRDGIGASIQGEIGEGSLFVRLTEALQVQLVSGSPGSNGSAQSASGRITSLLSDVASEALFQEQETTYQTARFTTLQAQEMSKGVDTDQELQQLLVVEQAYAANARVIQTIDTLIRTLLEI